MLFEANSQANTHSNIQKTCKRIRIEFYLRTIPVTRSCRSIDFKEIPCFMFLKVSRKARQAFHVCKMNKENIADCRLHETQVENPYVWLYVCTINYRISIQKMFMRKDVLVWYILHFSSPDKIRKLNYDNANVCPRRR